MTVDHWRTLRRAAFWTYVVVLFTATHTPRVEVPMREIRLDLFVHVAAFGLLAALLVGAGYFGPPLSGRNILCALVVALLYAAVDEALQAIPFLHRTAALDDWAGDAGGIVLACLGAWLVGAAARRSRPAP